MSKPKFRAWDKITKQYYVVSGLEYDDDGNLDEVYLAGIKISESNPVWNLRKPNDVVIEQYTDVKDKNGREIYEGDIVRIDSMDELRVGYVELVADQYCIVCGEEDGHKIVAEFYYYSKPEENCEVIGNIHENHELLGEQKCLKKSKKK